MLSAVSHPFWTKDTEFKSLKKTQPRWLHTYLYKTYLGLRTPTYGKYFWTVLSRPLSISKLQYKIYIFALLIQIYTVQSVYSYIYRYIDTIFLQHGSFYERQKQYTLFVRQYHWFTILHAHIMKSNTNIWNSSMTSLLHQTLALLSCFKMF